MNVLCPTAGIYPHLPLAAYHGIEICPAPSISGSGLVTLAPPEPVPEKFWDASTLNPNREPVDTAALRAGKCFHTLFLEGMDAVQQGYVIDNLPRTGEGSKTALTAFKAKAEAENKIIIRAAGNTQETGWDEIQAMHAKLSAHPKIRAAFGDGRPEVTGVWQDEETGVWCRMRPDWLPDDVTHMPELKTARSAAKVGFENAIKDYGYHVKAAHIMDGCRALGLGDPKTFTHYVIETSRPYCWAIHTLPRETLEYAIVQRRSALRIFADCLASGKWPGYPEHVQETGLPVYQLARLQRADLSAPSQQEKPNVEPVDRSRYLDAG